MITPVLRDGLVWWMPTKFAKFYDLFLCVSDEGRLYCEVKFESI